MSSAVVLLSSGLDSTVNLYAALNKNIDVKLALTIDYGQRAAAKEISQARLIAAQTNVPHQVVEISWLKNITKTALVNRGMAVPTGTDVSIDDFTVSTESAKAVWVPNRNGIFLNIAAAFAETLKAEQIIPGFNLEEATTFPDNSADFLNATDKALSFSTATKVITKCFTTSLNKNQIVKLGKTLNVPFDLIWPCYFGEEKICGTCESCQRYRRAIAEAEKA